MTATEITRQIQDELGRKLRVLVVPPENTEWLVEDNTRSDAHTDVWYCEPVHTGGPRP